MAFWESNTFGGSDPTNKNKLESFYNSMASNVIPTTPTVAIGTKQTFT